MSGAMTPGSPLGSPDMASVAQNFDQNVLPVEAQLQAVGIPTQTSNAQQTLTNAGQGQTPFLSGADSVGSALPAASTVGNATSSAASAVNNVAPTPIADNPAYTPVQAGEGNQPASSPVQSAPDASGNSEGGIYAQQSQAQASQKAADDSWGGSLSNPSGVAPAAPQDPWKQATGGFQQAPSQSSASTMSGGPALPANSPAASSLAAYGYNADGTPMGASQGASQGSSSGVGGNNFGNIRPVGASTGFVSYATPVDGVAAMSNQLAIDGTKHGITTLNQLTSSWAPKGDGKNDPVGYAKFLGTQLGIDPNAPINLSDKDVQAKLIPAMAQMEHGKANLIDPQTLQAGIAQGLQGKVNATGVIQSTSGETTGGQFQDTPQSGAVARQQAALASMGITGNGPIAGVGTGGSTGLANIMDQLRSVGIDPKTLGGNPLLAMAAGFAGKRNFGEAMSGAFGNLNQQQMQRADLGFKLAQMGQEADYRNAQLGMQQNQFGLENRKLDQQIGYQNTMAGLAAGRLNDQNQRTAAMYTPDGRAALTDSAQGRMKAMGENFKEQTEMEDAGQSAAGRLGNWKDFIATASNPGSNVGADLFTKAKQVVTQVTGVNMMGSDVTSQQLATKLSLMNQQEAAEAMRGLGLRTQREFGVFVESMPGLGTDPKAAQLLGQRMVNEAQSELATWNAWGQLSPDQREQALHTINGVADFRRGNALQAANTNAQGTLQPNGTGSMQIKPGAKLSWDPQKGLQNQ